MTGAYGVITLTLENASNNTLVAGGVFGNNNTLNVIAGTVSLGAGNALNIVRLLTTDSFSAGEVNLTYE
jgi:hypothetical protein